MLEDKALQGDAAPRTTALVTVAMHLSSISPAAAAMNQRIAKLLTRFGADGEKILEEASKSPPSPQTLLRHPAFVSELGQIMIHPIGTMDALLEMAIGGKPAIAPPKGLPPVIAALRLFLQLNHTPEFGWRENDTPDAWSTRIIDALFFGLSRTKVFSPADFMALDRISQNPIWLGLFSYALGMFLSAVADKSRVAALDRSTSSAAVSAFKASATARRARLPKVKYGNPMASFRDVAEYAIGEYLDGLNVNDALARTLVQTQLGLNEGNGKEKFDEFLKNNRISPETFPNTVAVLFEMVEKSCKFQESEGEVAAVCWNYGQEKNETGKIEKIFSSFADAVFPVAAKCRRQFSFGQVAPNEAALIIARWAKRSRVLADMRAGGISKQVKDLMPEIGKDERRALLAFRDGRTESKSISAPEVQTYVRARCKLLTLSAQQSKITRVEQLMNEQINGAEQFVLRPGQPTLQDMTYGVDVFFRALSAVLTDICDGTGAMLRDQMKLLSDFQRKYGPLAIVALLHPMLPGVSVENWIREAREKLQKVDPEFFAA